jgi:hypothetical protein
MSDNNKTVLVNCLYEYYDVYIGRPSIWGNPFILGENCFTRKECIRKYKEWFLKNEYLLSKVHLLEGKRLGCFCVPDKECHGQVFIDYLNKLKNKELFFK